MKHLSISSKEIIVKKVLMGRLTISEAASQNNVGQSSISKWVKIIREEGSLSGRSEALPDMIPSWEDRFKHLQATSGQDNVIVSAYCRQHGLYPHQLIEWEEEFMTKSTSTKELQNRIELRKIKAENKKLKQEMGVLSELCQM